MDNPPIDIVRSHVDDEDLEITHSLRHEQGCTPQAQTGQQASADADEKYSRDVPPDGGYGWVCVACVFWINAHTWGINSVSLPFSRV